MNQTNYLALKVENVNLPIISVKQGEINFNLDDFEKQIDDLTNVINQQQLNINNVDDFYNLRAKLNNFAKKINDEKIKINKEYNQVYKNFENQVKKCKTLIENASKHIDQELKDYEEQQKQILREEYIKLWESFGKSNFIAYERIEYLYGAKWFLKSASKKKVLIEMSEINDSINKSVEILKNTIEDEKEFNAVLRNYYNSLDLAQELGEYTKWKNTINQEKIVVECVEKEVLKTTQENTENATETKFHALNEELKVEEESKKVQAIISFTADEKVVDYVLKLLDENNIKYNYRKNNL